MQLHGVATKRVFVAQRRRHVVVRAVSRCLQMFRIVDDVVMPASMAKSVQRDIAHPRSRVRVGRYVVGVWHVSIYRLTLSIAVGVAIFAVMVRSVCRGFVRKSQLVRQGLCYVGASALICVQVTHIVANVTEVVGLGMFVVLECV